ncbi:MAG: TIGR04282 family arsenosugar biosynthesis glycosyltransferase [Planctomycetota bacterium]
MSDGLGLKQGRLWGGLACVGLVGGAVWAMALAWVSWRVDRWQSGDGDAVWGTIDPAWGWTAVGLMMGAGVWWLVTLTGMVRWRRIASWRAGVLAVLVAGGAMRAVMFGSLPMMEDDYHRTLWDGSVVAAGLDPYAVTPAEVRDGTAPVSYLALAQEPGAAATLERINHAEIATIYPGLTQAAAALGHWIDPWGLVGLRLIVTVSDLLVLLAVWSLVRVRDGGERGRRAAVVGGVAWWCNPLVVLMGVGAVHLDTLAIAGGMAALACAARVRRTGWRCDIAGRKSGVDGRGLGWSGAAGALLGLGIGAKLWPALWGLLVLGWVGRSGRPVWVGRVLAVALAGGLVGGGLVGPLVWHTSRGGEVSIDPAEVGDAGVTNYATRWSNNAPIYTAHAAAWREGLAWWDENWRGVTEQQPDGRRPWAWSSELVARGVTVGVIGAAVLVAFGGVILGVGGRSEEGLVGWALLVLVVAFLVGPTAFPWYFVWGLGVASVLVASSGVGWKRVGGVGWAWGLGVVVLPLYYVQVWDMATHDGLMWVQHGVLGVGVLGAGLYAVRASSASKSKPTMGLEMGDEMKRIAVVIPALNEAASIGKVVSGVRAVADGINAGVGAGASAGGWVLDRVVVVDNGSSDGTDRVAAEAGAEVVREDQRGYGRACLTGLGYLEAEGFGEEGEVAGGGGGGVVLFMDADYADRPEDLPAVVGPVVRGEADLVIGSRVLGEAEKGSLTIVQRFGNGLATRLLRWAFGVRFTDLGPFRAVSWEALKRLEMDDEDFGWTVQMQARAAARGVLCTEVPVAYRKRIGKSKISGTVRGVVLAGTKILWTIGAERVRLMTEDEYQIPKIDGPERLIGRRLILFTKYPVPGLSKTRMIPALGEAGAAALQEAMTRHLMETLGGAFPLEVRYAGGSEAGMVRMFGPGRYASQGEGDLGERLAKAVREAFEGRAGGVVVIGADCPQITPGYVEAAFSGLVNDDMVIGPARDGGYTLIGLRVAEPAVFAGIDWGTERVFEQTMVAAGEAGLGVKVLGELDDVDRPEDLGVWEAVKAGRAKGG